MKKFIIRASTKHLFLSIIFLLTGLAWSNIRIENSYAHYVFSLLPSSLFLTLGVGLFVGVMLTYVIQTEEFVEYITNQLKKIVVSKEFLWRLNDNEKKQLLESTIGPEGDISKLHPEVSRYFKLCVDGIIRRFGESFRGQMTITAVAKFDFVKKCVKIEWDTYHAIYKTAGRFEPISYHLSCGDSGFDHDFVRIEAPGNQYKVFGRDDISEKKSSLSAMETKIEIEVPSEYTEHNELFIRRKFVEYGQNHWQLFMYKATKPCHRLMVKLRCENGIVIREHAVVGTNEDFIIKGPNPACTEIEFCYNEWLDAGYGVCAVLSLDHAKHKLLCEKAEQEASIADEENITTETPTCSTKADDN